MTDFACELQVATQLARTAGAAILKVYAQQNPQVDYKGKGEADPVTAADREANALIVAGLTKAFPHDGILAEESVLDPGRHTKERLWCVDPLDGTREFIEKNGQFVVMIGLAIAGRSRLGVVYQPTTGILFAGCNQEAWMDHNGQRTVLKPSAESIPSRARLVVSRSHRSATVAKLSESLNITNERPLGSVGLKATQVALAAADLYVSVSTQTHEWDACAPEAILTAAGGRMTDCLGNPLCYNKPTTQTPHGILATNGALHAVMVAALAPIAKERGWI